MYLTNKKLIVYEDPSKGYIFASNFSMGVAFISIVGLALLSYTMYNRTLATGEVMQA